MSLDRYLTARGFQGLESPDLVFAYPRYLTSIRSYYRTTIQRREHRQLDHRALDATWLSIIQSYVPSDYCEVLVVEVTNELPDRRTTQTKTVQWHDAHATHTIEDMISQAGRNQILVRLTQKGWVSLTLSTCQATLPTGYWLPSWSYILRPCPEQTSLSSRLVAVLSPDLRPPRRARAPLPPSSCTAALVAALAVLFLLRCGSRAILEFAQLEGRATDATWIVIIEALPETNSYDILTVEVTALPPSSGYDILTVEATVRSYTRTIERRFHGEVAGRAADAAWLKIIETKAPSLWYDILTVEVTGWIALTFGTLQYTLPTVPLVATYLAITDRVPTFVAGILGVLITTHVIENMISREGRNQAVARLTQKGWIALDLGTCQYSLPTVSLIVTYLAITDRVPAFVAGILGVVIAAMVLYFKAIG
ncbi:hypothetical protein Dda_8715 [Drechslerella dactyloides]|uniref:Uncharacterized protein n=1 Tax=Drechslerella dactyloides TaxID=74499 RepID=A0AAD6IU99_DREDA|nr:hypothetical protein Dda_8715 [Drechslerella dactyloides]